MGKTTHTCLRERPKAPIAPSTMPCESVRLAQHRTTGRAAMTTPFQPSAGGPQSSPPGLRKDRHLDALPSIFVSGVSPASRPSCPRSVRT